jgi:glycosyltransferase involved in cell wall biosynthesis
MAEMVAHRQTGLHFVPGNPADLGAKVEWAWTHTEEMVAMGLEARREYEQRYTAETSYCQLMSVYQAAIARKQRE